MSGLRVALASFAVTAAAVAAVVGCGYTSASPTSSLSTAPPPQGDSTSWLQSQLDAMKAGDVLTLEPRVYQHSGLLKLNVSGVQINGNGATLQATNDATSAVQILADNVTLSNLNLTAPPAGRRFAGADQAKLLVRGNAATVRGVTITGSAAAGVVVSGAGNFILDQVTVNNTRADGIHMTNGAHDGHVTNASTRATGDDGIAVVSYAKEPICHDIVITSPTVDGTTNGRGISVVGGQAISYRNIAVSRTNGAGVYLADEGEPWYTTFTSNVDVTGGTINQANISTDIVHGAVLVYSGSDGQSVDNVTVSGLTISNTPTSADRNVGIVVDAGSVDNVAFNNIALQRTQAEPFSTTPNVPASSFSTSGWTHDGQPIAAD